MKINIISSLLINFALVSQVVSQTAPVVDLGYAQFQGFQNSTIGINYYRGLRYAQPPVADLRWRAPQPIERNNSYSGIVDASQEGPVCVQGIPVDLTSLLSADGALPNQQEDCLLLDVLVPINPVSPSIPVIVQIHGGGYTVGDALSYPGDAIVNRSDGNVIYVQTQYRLGTYGFLGGAEVASDGVLNAGLLDQRAALDWVQRHISKFGGDPAKVTIIGGSAGGGSVTFQLMANGGSGTPPFRAAIAQYPWWQPMNTPSTQEIQYRTVLSLAGCSDLACLRSLDAAALQGVSTSSYAVKDQPQYAYGVFDYGPVVDGEFVRELPDQAFKLGNFFDVPLIVDRDGYEGVIFTDMSVPSQEDETTDAELLFPSGGPAFFSQLYQLYPASAYNSTGFQRQTWFGDFIINCPTYIMASSAVDINTNSSAIYKLIFEAGSELHGASSAFLFSTNPDFPGANNLTIAEIITSYYTSFAITLDPNSLSVPGSTYWPPYISGGQGTVANGESVGFSVLDITYTTITVETDPDLSPKCFFFSSQGHVLAN